MTTPESIESRTEYLKTLVLPPPLALAQESLLEDDPGVPGEITLDAEGKLLKNYLFYKDFVGYLNEAFDQALSTDIPKIIASTNISLPDSYITFDPKSIIVRQPTYEENKQAKPLYPQIARDRHLTYGITIYCDMLHVKKGTNQVLERRRQPVGTLPIPLGSEYCYLHGKNDEERAKIGECPHDPLNYFIVDGTEKVMILQEMLRKNKIFIFNKSSKGETVANITCDTPSGSKIVNLVLGKNNDIELMLNGFKKNKEGKPNTVGVMQAFRMLGVTDPAQIITFIKAFTAKKNSNKVLLALAPSFIKLKEVANDFENIGFKMLDSQKAIEAKRDKKKKNTKKAFEVKGVDLKTPEGRKAAVLEILRNELFPFVNDEPSPDLSKIYLLTMMLVKLAEYLAGVRPLDDRDSWSNKLLRPSGQIVTQLFRVVWIQMIHKLEEDLAGVKSKTFDTVARRFTPKTITETFNNSFVSPNWGVRGRFVKQNVTQILKRDSLIQTFSHITQIDVNTSRNDRHFSIRMVQNTQYGFICCVTGDTQILLSDGKTLCPIKDIQGKSVLSVNPETFENEPSDIYNFFTFMPKKLLEITDVCGRKIKCTPDHPFLCRQKGDEDYKWIQAQFMKNNDMVLIRDELNMSFTTYSYIKSIEEIDTELVYDFTTESSNHSFIANGFVVHNCVETPEGENAGIIKHMAITSSISIERDERLVRKNINPMISPIPVPGKGAKCVINGKFLGWVSSDEVITQGRILRRSRILPEGTSLVYDQKENTVYVYSDAGRPLRPLLIVNEQTQRLVIDEKNLWGAPWAKLVAEGCVEYIDPWEQEFLDIAMSKEEPQQKLKEYEQNAQLVMEEAMMNEGGISGGIGGSSGGVSSDNTQAMSKQLKQRKYTHCELDPTSVLGFAAAIIPFPNHNQGPRNLFQCLEENVLVWMDEGLKKMKDIKNGDIVKTVNPETFEISLSKVKNHFLVDTKISGKKVYELKAVGHNKIIATEDHKFLTLKSWFDFTPNKVKWIQVKDLVTDDMFCIFNGKDWGFVRFKSKQKIKSCIVGDFETESENHSFICGDGFLSHNCSMSKQALGLYHSNYLNRFDGNIKTLAHPTRPMFDPQLNGMIGADRLPAGEMVMMMFGTYTGYTQEDAFVFNRSSVQRGLFQMVKWSIYSTTIKETGVYTESLSKPVARPNEDPQRYSALGDDGLPVEGRPIKDKQCIIGKIRKTSSTGEVRNVSEFMGVGEEGIVDKVFVDRNTATNEVRVTVRVRDVRSPIVGDKFAPRHAQKGTIGIMLDQEDMPFTFGNREMPTVDIIANPHCVVGDTKVSLYHGVSRKIKNLSSQGGEALWAWNPDKSGLTPSIQLGMDPRGKQKILKITLEDGRILRCTPDHKILVSKRSGMIQTYEWIEAKDLQTLGHFDSNKGEWISHDGTASNVIIGPDYPLDDSTKEERDIEISWSLKTTEYNFNMQDVKDREATLAFMRILGIVVTDGSVGFYNCVHGDQYKANISLGHAFDLDQCLRDVCIVTGKTPKPRHDGKVWVFNLPTKLARSIASIEGIMMGKRIYQESTWPSFLLSPDCPVSIIREFLGGIFGGDGHAPCLVRNTAANRKAKSGEDMFRFSDIRFSKSGIAEFLPSLEKKMQQLCFLLERVGVHNAKVSGPITHNVKEDAIHAQDYKENPRSVYSVTIPNSTEFAEKVGYRYCIQKTCRLTIANSYWRYIETVKSQHDRVIERTNEIHKENKEKDHKFTLAKALALSRLELLRDNPPLNVCYSLSDETEISNRRRKARQSKLEKLDYRYIYTPEQFLELTGCKSWFNWNGTGEGNAVYVVTHDMDYIPKFKLRVLDIRDDGEEEVYDISVSKIESFLAEGIVISNCQASRMTWSFIMEIMASKAGALRGERINATAFRPFEQSKYEQTMRDYGFQRKGYVRMMSGFTGKMLETPVFAGPCYYQALRHHVKDKYQARQCGGVKASTHVPVGGRKLRGGLRFGEQERDSMISHGASRFLQERLRDAADSYTTVYCKTCGTIANSLALGDNYSCRLCRSKANFGQVTIPYVFKYLGHLLNGMNMNMSFVLVTEDEFKKLQDVQEGKSEAPSEITANEIEEIEEEEERARKEQEGEEEFDIFAEAQGEGAGFEGFEFGKEEAENEYEE